jgi:hypothetical protein
MLFWSHFRGGPTDWICILKSGRPTKQGTGLSFYYIPDFATVVSVPTGVTTTDFHFEERSSDYQSVHVHGVLTWRITQPEQAAKLLDFSVDQNNRHLSEDPKKLEEKLQHLVAVLGRRLLKGARLEDALKSADSLADSIRAGLAAESYLGSVGIEALSVEILSVKPEPEVGRALEASTREALLKQSDDATAQRRLAALENERIINEREAGNELAKEKAARAVTEARENHARLEQQHQVQLAKEKQEAELARRARDVDATHRETIDGAHNEAERDLIRMKSALELNTREQELADGRLAVARKDAEAEKARVDVLFTALRTLSAEQLQALSLMGAQPGATIASAFQKLAERAGAIGQLNISPDLLQSIIQSKAGEAPAQQRPAARG